ncbi:MAG: hypothetical protein LBI05_07415 [Planctomycetaceae bacterium]|jgi:hypothetical protein|nr:hypothetical protein [Planctomycetaceae bacterium]
MAVIAFVGPFGSGCTAIADLLIKEKKYKRISLDSCVREDFYKAKKRHPSNRSSMYDFADDQRLRYGVDYFAKLALDTIKGGDNIIIDDMKHVAEIRYAKLKFPKIIIFGVQADVAERWDRLKEFYREDKAAFDLDNTRELGSDGGMPFRQNVKACFAKSNVIVNNQGGIIAVGNAYTEELTSELIEKIDWYSKYPPSEASPVIIDAAANLKAWEWKWSQRGRMALTIVLSAVIGGGIFSVIGYAVAPRNAVVLTTLTHLGFGIKVGAVVCLIGLIIFGYVWKARKSKSDDDTIRRR